MMGFRLVKQNEGIKWPVVIHEPRAGGAVREHTIKVYFRVKEQDEIDALVEEGDYEFMLAVIDAEQGWEGVTQESQEEEGADVVLPYSPEALDQLLQIPYIKSAFITAYFNFVGGVGRKNSRKRPGTG